jgi:hypothetical protein
VTALLRVADWWERGCNPTMSGLSTKSPRGCLRRVQGSAGPNAEPAKEATTSIWRVSMVFIALYVFVADMAF